MNSIETPPTPVVTPEPYTATCDTPGHVLIRIPEFDLGMDALKAMDFASNIMIAAKQALSHPQTHFASAPDAPKKCREQKEIETSVAQDLLDAAVKALDECCDLIATDAGNALDLAIARARSGGMKGSFKKISMEKIGALVSFPGERLNTGEFHTD